MNTLSLTLTKEESKQIAAYIEPIFNNVLNEYDFGKYPAENYEQFKQTYSALPSKNQEIRDSLRWKWGHWVKSNFTQSHHALIEEVKDHWKSFISSGASQNAKITFDWWSATFNRKTTFITTAYITHLVHHSDPLPIIDQHNFRAMNALLRQHRPAMKAKKRPSNWNDIESLKNFMLAVQSELDARTFSELDRFLMMYGRNYALR